jgi:hypothetical protein
VDCSIRFTSFGDVWCQACMWTAACRRPSRDPRGKPLIHPQSPVVVVVTIGLQIRSVLATAVYRKSLVLSPAARQNATVGEVVNMMQLDAARLQEVRKGPGGGLRGRGGGTRTTRTCSREDWNGV